MWPLQCRLQGDNRWPGPAGHTVSGTDQDGTGHWPFWLPEHMLAHVQLTVDQHSQVLFCWATLQPLFPQSVALPGVVVGQVQDLALHLIETHTIGLSH